LNKLLHVSKNLLLFILLAIILIFIITTILNNTKVPSNETVQKSKEPNFDIINPSFTINNEQKISVKAKRGNFISDQKILLENNVINITKLLRAKNFLDFNLKEQLLFLKDLKLLKMEIKFFLMVKQN